MATSTATGTPIYDDHATRDGNATKWEMGHRPMADEPMGDGRGADIVLGAAVVAMGLFAGLFFTFTTAVMPGLAAADERTLVDAMQQMIDNPVFPLIFLAAGALAVAALIRARGAASGPAARWIGISLVFYVVTVVITFTIHAPLNEGLMAAGDPDRIANLSGVRDEFAGPWIAWDLARTLTSAAAFGSLTWALVSGGRTG